MDKHSKNLLIFFSQVHVPRDQSAATFMTLQKLRYVKIFYKKGPVQLAKLAISPTTWHRSGHQPAYILRKGTVQTQIVDTAMSGYHLVHSSAARLGYMAIAKGD